MKSPPIVIWRFTDGKIGHEKQSQALIEGLNTQRDIKYCDIEIKRHSLYYLFRWLGNLPIIYPKNKNNLDSTLELKKNPDILIGAGHKTHLPMLLVKQQYKCKALVIMSPSLPACFFDAIIAPEHDYINKKKADNVITTLTALAPIIKSYPNSTEGLILLGGESKHFYWEDTEILKEIDSIISLQPKETIWNLSNSRRTPESTMACLREKYRGHHNINIFEHTLIPQQWLETQLKTAGNIWITEDSASMTAEALNSGAKVGLISLKSKKNNGKIQYTNKRLVESGLVSYNASNKKHSNKKISAMTTTIDKTLRLLEI